MRTRAGAGWRLWRMALLAVALLGGRLAFGQTAEPPPLDPLLYSWGQTLEEVERQTSDDDLGPAVGDRLEADVQKIIGRAYNEQARITARIDRLHAEANLLTELKPGELLPPELEQRRQFVIAAMARDQAWLLDIRILRVRAQEALRRIGDLEQLRLQQEIRIHTPSPFLATTWRQAGERAAILWATLQTELANDPLGDLASPMMRPLFVLLIGFMAVVLGSLWLRHLVFNWLKRQGWPIAPSPPQRLYPILPCAAAVFIVLATGMMFIHGNVERSLIGQTPLQALVIGLLKGCVALVMLTTASRAILALDHPAWRIVPLTSDAARAMARSVWLVAASFTVSAVLLTTVHSDRPLYLPLIGAAGVIDACLKAAAGWVLFAPRNWQLLPTAMPRRWYSDGLRWMVVALLNTPLVLAAFGHAELGEEIVARATAAVLLFGSVAVLRSAALHGISGSDATTIGAQRTLPVFSILLDLILLVGMAYLTLLLLNISRSLIDAWLSTAVDGFVIAGVTISARSVVTAILATMAVLALTRFTERLVLRRLLSHSAMDVGVRDAVAASVRYVGIAVALVVGVASLGLSLSNVALFASALSVGIGFGLRAIVENFVAGLLLLFERPIRAGDWIVVGDKEGIVRRISARATEVETFDRATVIIPNSQLITGAVVNWTHADRVARVTVRVVVPSGSPAEEIRQLLLDCADEHPQVLKAPPPTALFIGFDDKALTFELRCFVSDATYYASVRSDLNFAIDKRVRRVAEDVVAAPASAAEAEDTV